MTEIPQPPVDPPEEDEPLALPPRERGAPWRSPEDGKDEGWPDDTSSSSR